MGPGWAGGIGIVMALAVMGCSDDGDCANDGCIVAGYPMPFADLSSGGFTDAGHAGDLVERRQALDEPRDEVGS